MPVAVRSPASEAPGRSQAESGKGIAVTVALSDECTTAVLDRAQTAQKFPARQRIRTASSLNRIHRMATVFLQSSCL
jgi:hypothetical protein